MWILFYNIQYLFIKSVPSIILMFSFVNSKNSNNFTQKHLVLLKKLEKSYFYKSLVTRFLSFKSRRADMKILLSFL